MVGDVANGVVWGRGAADMKGGTSASFITYAYLHRIREQLKGRLTLTAVSMRRPAGVGVHAISSRTMPTSVSVIAY